MLTFIQEYNHIQLGCLGASQTWGSVDLVVKYHFKANMVGENISSLYCLHYLVYFDQTVCIFTKVHDQALQPAVFSDVYVQTLQNIQDVFLLDQNTTTLIDTSNFVHMQPIPDP